MVRAHREYRAASPTDHALVSWLWHQGRLE
jgi:hypothetical protein